MGSHIQSAGKAASLNGLGGVSPVPFLVFTAMTDVAKAYGQRETQTMLNEATAAYKQRMLPSFQPVRLFGGEAVLSLYKDMVQGRTSPERSYICSFWPEELH